MSRFARAYVHIGINKTGSSSIQAVMARSRGRLIRKWATLYSAISRNHSMPLYTMFSDDPASFVENKRRGLTDPVEIAAANDKTRAALHSEFTHSDAQQLVLSGEALSILSRAGVERFSSWLGEYAKETFVIAYVRHPVDWASSAAQQRIQAGGRMRRFDSHPPLAQMRKRLEPWMAVFGRDTMVLADFQAAVRHPRGLTGHFASLIGIGHAFSISAATVRINESLSAEAISIMEMLNRMRETHCSNREIEILRRIEGRKFRLGEAALATVRNAAQADLEWLYENFGLHLIEAAPSATTEPLFSEATIRSLAMLVIELGRGDGSTATAASRATNKTGGPHPGGPQAEPSLVRSPPIDRESSGAE
jgi:hypothetical protein